MWLIGGMCQYPSGHSVGVVGSVREPRVIGRERDMIWVLEGFGEGKKDERGTEKMMAIWVGGEGKGLKPGRDCQRKG